MVCSIHCDETVNILSFFSSIRNRFMMPLNWCLHRVFNTIYSDLVLVTNFRHFPEL